MRSSPASGGSGTWFGSETFGLKPDTVTMAKALTSAYAPLGAVTVPEPVYQAMLDQSRKIGAFAHGFTYGGHPLAAAFALKALEIYERDDILGQSQARLIPRFQARLKALADHPLVGEARGLGLMGAVELVADKATKRAVQSAGRSGRTCLGAGAGRGPDHSHHRRHARAVPRLRHHRRRDRRDVRPLARGLDRAQAMVAREGLAAA